jgi:uncharacterized protein YlxP (DUF503 family)
MVVGVCRLVLHLPENGSLKEKRQVVRSLLARLQNQFHVAAAEVGDLDSWRFATLGVSCVSNDAAHANSILSKVVAFVASSRLDAVLEEHQIELITV